MRVQKLRKLRVMIDTTMIDEKDTTEAQKARETHAQIRNKIHEKAKGKSFLP